MDRGTILRKAMPLVAVALPDGDQAMTSQGANVIMGMEKQAGRRAATTAAFAASRTAGSVALEVGERGAVRLGVAVATKGAMKYGALAIPVVGEAAGAAMLAYDAWKLSYRAVTGRSFEQTSVGKAVNRAENGAWRAGAHVFGGLMDYVGLHKAARLTRGPLLELVTGEEQPTPAATPKAPGDAKSAADGHGQATKAAAATAAAGTPATGPARAGTADGSGRLTPGPTRPLSDADWKEPPYALAPGGKAAAVATTPLGRSFSIMDMLVDDTGLPRANRIVGPPARSPQPTLAKVAGARGAEVG